MGEQDSTVQDTGIERDVVIVGGGAAGLSAAIALARFDRSVEVIDAGVPRNAAAGGVHNLLGHDGVPPAPLLATGREELRRFGGRLTVDTAVAAAEMDGLFIVSLASGERRIARRLIVTSGVRDVLPDVPGLAARWGRDVLHCPYCHGFEVRHQSIGVLATGPAAVHQAMLFRELSDDVVVFAHTAVAFTVDQLEQLHARDVSVLEGRVTGIEVKSGKLSGVRLAGGRIIARQALVVTPLTEATSEILDSLGVPRVDDGPDGYAHDESGATSVPGVWIAGNLADPFAPVVVASAGGLTAASAVNADLMTERIRTAVAVRRAAAFDDATEGARP